MLGTQKASLPSRQKILPLSLSWASVSGDYDLVGVSDNKRCLEDYMSLSISDVLSHEGVEREGEVWVLLRSL